jgi:succinate dehydrogenase / fumarate reductase, cytochrome b subunit
MSRRLPYFALLFGRHEFLIRRLHSFLGLLPLAGYLFFHLAINATVLDGAPTYQSRVDLIHSFGPTTLLILEWAFILLPILFHGIIGLVIIASGKINVPSYPYLENWGYTALRIAGIITFFFVLYHVFQMYGWFHFSWWKQYVSTPFGGGRFDPKQATATAVEVLQSPAIAAIYAVGILAAVVHWAIGLWTFGITWGIWTSPRAQRAAQFPCAAAGAIMLVIGWGALYGFVNFRQPLDQLAALFR